MNKPVHSSSAAISPARPFRPQVAILTGGADRPYALGLAGSLMAEGVPFDFIGSDEVNGPELHGNPLVRFLNLRGAQNPDASAIRKLWRVAVYYVRLLWYALASPAPVFHILWNNKFELFDRTVLMALYRLRGRQVVFTAHNVNIRKRDGRDTWLNRWSLGIQYRLCAQIFVHTERMRQELLTEFAVPADKASVIPFGINSTVPDTALTGAEARTQLGLARGDKVILFFGNIAPYKGVEHLLEAFISLAGEMPELRLVIAGRPKGEAEYWGRLERRIGDCGFKDRIVLRIEYVPDADTEIYFKAADVLALPYNHIFQSGVLFLGYNFGLPVLATDVGSLKDDVVEGETGFVCPPRDAQAMAGSLKKYFGSELYHELPTKRARIKDFATDRYSWAKVASISRRAYAAALC